LIESQQKPTLIPKLEKITQIVCGANHALALDLNGMIWSWGCSEKGQLGRRPSGRGYTQYIPHRMGVVKAKYIASGEYHSFAVDAKDNVWAWGMNRFGEAGHARSAGTDDVILPHPLKILDLQRKGVVHMDAGLSHSAAVTKEGDCLVWGRMDVGQLGIRFSTEQLQDDSLIRSDERGNPRICLRPTVISSVGKTTLVACGTDHTLFVNAEGSAFATGFNSQYQLGLGHDNDVEVARRIKGEAKDRVITWAGAGGQFSMIAEYKSSVID
jgi:regulator of chromosome condensation